MSLFSSTIRFFIPKNAVPPFFHAHKKNKTSGWGQDENPSNRTLAHAGW